MKKRIPASPSAYIHAFKLRSTDELSDEDLKVINGMDDEELARGILDLGPPFEPWELKYLNSVMEKKSPYTKHSMRYADEWKDDVLQGYMDHIKNYYYKYKDEATDIDPSIDPNEQHIGPMAQDIEKVNPAAIKENEDGVKSVDTGRLALMNAGAIAELAREVMKLKEAQSA